MSATAASTAIWTMHAERWRRSIKAKSLPVLTERSYLLTAQRWIAWLDGEGPRARAGGGPCSSCRRFHRRHHYRDLAGEWRAPLPESARVLRLAGQAPRNAPQSHGSDRRAPRAGKDHATAHRRGASASPASVLGPRLRLAARHGHHPAVHRHRPASPSSPPDRRRDRPARGAIPRARQGRQGPPGRLRQRRGPGRRQVPQGTGRPARFEDQVDPDRTLPADERERLALSARRAHFRRLALCTSVVRSRGLVGDE